MLSRHPVSVVGRQRRRCHHHSILYFGRAHGFTKAFWLRGAAATVMAPTPSRISPVDLLFSQTPPSGTLGLLTQQCWPSGRKDRGPATEEPASEAGPAGVPEGGRRSKQGEPAGAAAAEAQRRAWRAPERAQSDGQEQNHGTGEAWLMIVVLFCCDGLEKDKFGGWKGKDGRGRANGRGLSAGRWQNIGEVPEAEMRDARMFAAAAQDPYREVRDVESKPTDLHAVEEAGIMHRAELQPPLAADG